MGLEQLKIYQVAEKLELELHEVTKSFPKDELYRSVDQIRRSSAAVANNLAEGYSRASNLEKIRYCHIAKGEAEETKRNVERSSKKGFLPVSQADQITNQYTELLKMISGYIKYLKEKAA
ncbi:hypothetical protein A3D62_01660 [Candidatus Kaiserbacteria bacterium RIFCSPHIGHO2_02_FULL_49_11]|uniref:Four helix bundle protein n=1 Tax=Candidatus Kaiserbacteria bacterium RIFCSPHIGHO2_02_FULL_49_11 TaxID=1798489 RepID=A0A1F6D1K4_9BACT|nr:MAG: hypothetical protein A3D62_01660 [Candidatus Kaiserbacteria bacterium RIFCSPHIGHO2_02_FULL_49_11]